MSQGHDGRHQVASAAKEPTETLIIISLDTKAVRNLTIVQLVVVVVKWSACSPSTPTIRVQIPLKHTVFSAQFVVKRTKINKKEAGVGPFLEKIFLMGQPRPLFLLFLFKHLQMTKMFLPIFSQFRFKFRINVRSCYLVQLKALPD